MMTEQQILDTLDNSSYHYGSFVALGHGYSHLLDTRLNIFRGDQEHWAIAVERLGYNPRAEAITLDIHYYGNCLINLEKYNNQPVNQYGVYPIDWDNFEATTDEECLKPDARFWLVRGQHVPLSHDKQAYTDTGIELKEYEPNTITIEEAGRLALITHRDWFRATDDELYQFIPTDLKKILALDEWFHKDFSLQSTQTMTDEHLRQTYEFNKKLTGLGGMSFESFAQALRQNELQADEWNKQEWEHNRPSTYETWQLIAKAIVTNDPTQYKPTLPANTHWKYWPDSGSL